MTSRWSLLLLSTLEGYRKDQLTADLLAAAIVTVLLIPQSLAYALLAGVPAEVGLYASILPLLVYALLGTSRTLSVGPVAVVSLMTASALANVVEQGTASYLDGAVTLAGLSGALLLLMGVLKLGFLAHFLSLPVVSGFIAATGVLIGLSQLKHLLGIDLTGQTALELTLEMIDGWRQFDLTTALVGVGVVVFLLWARRYFEPWLLRRNVSAPTAQWAAKSAPLIGVIATILLAKGLALDQHGLAVVGHVPSGLPSLALPTVSWPLIDTLMMPAIMISIIGYVESVSIGKTLAAKRDQSIDTNQELIGLGAANVASAASGAFPVTGGFSRSVVNFDAGAVTQMASVFTAIGIALVAVLLTPWLFHLPKATLAATILVAVVSLIDLQLLKKTWVFAKADFAAIVTTIVITLFFGVEMGVGCGVLTSLVLYIYRTSTPHIAEVGLIEGSEHFRNVLRHSVRTEPAILSLRIDESLFFANTHELEQRVLTELEQRPDVQHVILMCSAVNSIDVSALEMLSSLNQRLGANNIRLHFSEIKGPVMDSLSQTDLLNELSGDVFLTQYQAFEKVRDDGL